MVCAYFHPMSKAQPGIRWHSVNRHSALMLEGCKQVMRMNPDGDASCDGYVLSMISDTFGPRAAQPKRQPSCANATELIRHDQCIVIPDCAVVQRIRDGAESNPDQPEKVVHRCSDRCIMCSL